MDQNMNGIEQSIHFGQFSRDMPVMKMKIIIDKTLFGL